MDKQTKVRKPRSRTPREFNVFFIFADGTRMNVKDFKPDMLTEKQQRFIYNCLYNTNV